MYMSWYGWVETLKHPKCHALKKSPAKKSPQRRALKEMPSKKCPGRNALKEMLLLLQEASSD